MSQTQTKSATATKIEEFTNACKAKGFHFSTKSYGSDYVVTVEKSFAPGDATAYMTAENDSYTLLSMVPVVTYGSRWGSDSGSVGGHAALTSGNFHMCQSGVSKRFGAALAKVAR